MQTEVKKRYYTPAEYLELEEKAEYKSEYRNGEITPMTGGTTNHNKIAGNFYANFRFAMKGQDYEIFIGDVRLWIASDRIYTYPELMVVAGEPIYRGTGTTTIINPFLIVEVLSKSTRNRDRTDKFDSYRSIPEFREYILIDQYKYGVQQLAKNSSGKLVFTDYQSEDAVLVLESVEFQISLQDIYERVIFETSESQS